MDEDRRLLMGGSVCFGKFMVDVESLSHAAEKRIKDIGIYTTLQPRNTFPRCSSSPHPHASKTTVAQHAASSSLLTTGYV